MSTSEIQTPVNLFDEYSGVSGSYDEIFSKEKKLRAHWQRFAKSSRHISSHEFHSRWTQAQRLLRQNSLAYPDPSDPNSLAFPWQLDALPFVISRKEFEEVAEALSQRAQLLDLVIRDLCGPQKLLQERILPPEILYLHPGFHLPYSSTDATSKKMLHMYAADLARSPDGQWWVLGDRTEAPSGAGFAVENRIALSRILSDVIHQCEVQRLAPYFVDFKRQLESLSPQKNKQPHVVLLSRSGVNANYFEDATIARYLGYTLAEAGDLAVRDQKVYLKTLAGLSQVDVLWRRPNSEHCDSLELSSSSSIGVAGLLQAVRAGTVGLVNGLGTGLVESPVFMAFMPQLCDTLLDEELKMPGVATWWCGDPNSLKYVLSRLKELEIMPAFRQRGSGQGNAYQLSRLSPTELEKTIRANPAAYVAREQVTRSTAPVWEEDRVGTSFIALRAFAVTKGDGYSVMPGGLTRVSKSLAPLDLSLLNGEGSKDTWVYSEGPVKKVSLLTSKKEGVQIRRGGVNLPSRAAENFFWLGRNSVRAEILGRLIRALILRLTGEDEAENVAELSTLLRVLALQGQIEPGFVVEEIRPQLPKIENLLSDIVFENAQVGTLRSTVSSVLRLASSVRDLMSIDSWRILRQLDLDFWPAPNSEGLLDVMVKVEGLLVQFAAFGGYVSETMTRTFAWRFLDLGRRLERSLQTVGLIRTALTERVTVEQPTLEALLEICDGVMTYRSRYFSQVELNPVLDLLLEDETNPRSVMFQLLKCSEHVQHLPATSDAKVEQGLISSMLAVVQKKPPTQAESGDFAEQDVNKIVWLLKTIEQTLPKLSDAVSHRYFFHARPTQMLTGIKVSN